MPSNSRTKEEKNESLKRELIKQLLTLATSGFGLVAALAWNNFIQELVNGYVKKFLPGSGLISLLIYALIVTILAVIVTYQLSKLSEKVNN